MHLTKLLFPVVLLWRLAASNELDLSREILRGASSRQLPSLTAVTFRSIIQKREEAFLPKRDCEHHYADYNSILRGAESKFATTSMKYSLPTINLEDIELHIADIQCYGSSIAVEFRDFQTLNLAEKSWDGIPEFFIITSHPGCNKDGERAPHLVSSITYSKEIPIATFSAKQVAWKNAYDTMTVGFGSSQGRYKPDSIRIHNDLRKRQLIPTGTISYPSVPSPSTTASSVTHNINYQADPGAVIFTISHENEPIEESISVSCKNCSTAGTIEITEGVFTVNKSSKSFISEAVNFVNNGFFKAVANGVSAHVELETTLSLSTGTSFRKSLTTFTLPGFQIPGIAAVGPQLELDLSGDIEIAAELDFSYGFDLIIPDNSSILINMANLTQSSSSGFDNSQINALPLTASSPDFTLTLGLGLVAQLLVGVEILDDHGALGAGMFINLPHVGLTVSQIDSVNAQCEPVNGSTTIDGFLSTVFPNLTHIVPDAAIDIGLSATAGVDLPGVNVNVGAGITHTLTGIPFTLPTACMMWNSKNNEFTTPTTTTTASTSIPSPTGGAAKKANLAARRMSNPIVELAGLWWMLGMLLSVLFFAVSL